MKFKKSKKGLEEQIYSQQEGSKLQVSESENLAQSPVTADIHAHESENNSGKSKAVFQNGEEQSSPSHFSTAEIEVYEDCRGLVNGYCIPLQFFPRDSGCVKNCGSYRKPLIYVNREAYEET